MAKLNIEELLKIENIEPKDLASIIGIKNKSNIYEWLRGESLPSLNNMIKIADYFGCSIEYLLGRTKNMTKSTFKKCPPFKMQLEKIMNELGVSQYKFNKDKILNPSHFHRWKSQDATPDVDTVMKIADYLNISVDYLLGRE